MASPTQRCTFSVQRRLLARQPLADLGKRQQHGGGVRAEPIIPLPLFQVRERGEVALLLLPVSSPVVGDRLRKSRQGHKPPSRQDTKCPKGWKRQEILCFLAFLCLRDVSLSPLWRKVEWKSSAPQTFTVFPRKRYTPKQAQWRVHAPTMRLIFSSICRASSGRRTPTSI